MSCIFISFFHPPIHTPIVAFSITLQPAYYTPWTPWSEACSNDCGAGTQGRTRTCLGLCEPSKDPACAVGSDDPVTRPCSGGPAATWKEYEPQVCVGDQRPWTRVCDPRCHGTCAGSATEMRNCSWAPLIAWAGPLYPTASAPLTATMMASDLAAALRAAVMEAVIDNGEAVVGTVSALMDAATTDGERRRRRDQESALAHVDDGMVVTAGDAAGSVWLRVQAQLLPEAEGAISALLPLHTGNLTGTVRALAPKGVLITLSSDASSTSGTKDGISSSAGVAVGAALACLLCLIVIVVLVRRRKSRRFVSSVSTEEEKATVDGGTVTMRRDRSSETWSYHNPAFAELSNMTRASTVSDNAAPLSSSGADRHPFAVQGLTDNPAYEASSGIIQGTAAAKRGSMRDEPVYASVLGDTQSAAAIKYASMTDNPAYEASSRPLLQRLATGRSTGLVDNVAYLSSTPNRQQSYIAARVLTDGMKDDATYAIIDDFPMRPASSLEGPEDMDATFAGKGQRGANASEAMGRHGPAEEQGVSNDAHDFQDNGDCYYLRLGDSGSAV